MSDDDDTPISFHPAPYGLDRSGLAMWFSIAEKYKMRPDELSWLEDACRTVDMIARLDAAWVAQDCPMTTKGSMGQQVIHPLIGELRTQRLARAALLARLKLPDLDGEAEAPAANQHRSAAQSRWAVPNRGA